MINSRILREGHTVEGFRLVTIGEDGVIVQREGEKMESRIRAEIAAGDGDLFSRKICFLKKASSRYNLLTVHQC